MNEPVSAKMLRLFERRLRFDLRDELSNPLLKPVVESGIKCEVDRMRVVLITRCHDSQDLVTKHLPYLSQSAQVPPVLTEFLARDPEQDLGFKF